MTRPFTRPPTGPDSDADLAGLRAEVDVLDARIVDLLAARGEVVARIFRAKDGRVAPRVPDRDREVLSRVRGRAVTAGIDPTVVERIYRAVIDAFVEWQASRTGHP